MPVGSPQATAAIVLPWRLCTHKNRGVSNGGGDVLHLVSTVDEMTFRGGEEDGRKVLS
jgi:hypothetical protein